MKIYNAKVDADEDSIRISYWWGDEFAISRQEINYAIFHYSGGDYPRKIIYHGTCDRKDKDTGDFLYDESFLHNITLPGELVE